MDFTIPKISVYTKTHIDSVYSELSNKLDNMLTKNKISEYEYDNNIFRLDTWKDDCYKLSMSYELEIE